MDKINFHITSLSDLRRRSISILVFDLPRRFVNGLSWRSHALDTYQEPLSLPNFASFEFASFDIFITKKPFCSFQLIPELVTHLEVFASGRVRKVWPGTMRNYDKYTLKKYVFLKICRQNLVEWYEKAVYISNLFPLLLEILIKQTLSINAMPLLLSYAVLNVI